MSKEELNEFKVSAIFQNRLITALKGEKESHIELANEIGISKDILIRALNTGVIPGTRSLIKLADYTEESIDYLIGLIDTTFYAKSLDYPYRKNVDKISGLFRRFSFVFIGGKRRYILL